MQEPRASINIKATLIPGENLYNTPNNKASAIMRLRLPHILKLTLNN